MEDYYELTRDEMHRTVAWHITNDHYFAHFHSTIELAYVESGVICAFQDGVSTLVSQGRIIVNSSYMVHNYTTPESSRIIVATIPLSSVPALRAQLEQNHFARGIVDVSAMREVARLMRMMADPAHQRNARYVNSLSEALLSLLIEKIGLEPNRSDAEADLIKRILKYLREHCAEPLTVAKVAAHFGYSSGRFSHIFNLRVGCSLVHYVNGLRCRMAQRMMEASGAPLIEIADACGFASMRTFHRVYREHVGGTPRGERAEGTALRRF